MTQAPPLLITRQVVEALEVVRQQAATRPVAVDVLARTIKLKATREAHREHMTEQTVIIPGPATFLVTFSIETGHPAGNCRHMSMSVQQEDHVPCAQAVWFVAEVLGFTDGLHACIVYDEDLAGRGKTINVVQPIRLSVPGGTA